MRRAILTGSALSARIAPLRMRRHVALLAIRVTDLGRVAWRDGRTAARRLERRACDAFASGTGARMREADLLAHDPRSDVFTIALTASSRCGRSALRPEACRSALGRATEALRSLPLTLETGWTLVTREGRELTEELNVALEQGLREQERLDFFSPFAHEMRTPLTAIRGYLETLLDGPQDATTTRRFLEVARNEALRLGRLIDGALAVSLLDTEYGRDRVLDGAMPAQALERAIDVLAPRAAERAARIRARPLPSVRVALGFDHLVQIFTNVIGNAIEHGNAGARIAVSGRRHGCMLAIAVDDDGPGIAPDQRDAIFEFGYRTSNAGRGTGLGLAVVRGLLERAGGSAAATSSKLGGTRILLRMPTWTG